MYQKQKEKNIFVKVSMVMKSMLLKDTLVFLHFLFLLIKTKHKKQITRKISNSLLFNSTNLRTVRMNKEKYKYPPSI